jgi:putative ABC transport system ATP-binding protein
VALARAVLMRPRVLLADEPTASLDDRNAADAVQLLWNTAQNLGATLVIATHDARVDQCLQGLSSAVQRLVLGRIPADKVAP